TSRRERPVPRRTSSRSTSSFRRATKRSSGHGARRGRRPRLSTCFAPHSIASMAGVIAHAEPEPEEEEEPPAWSLPAGGEAAIRLENPLPQRIDREWAFGGATGRGVSVAILDSGVEFGHPMVGELAGAVAITVDENDDPVASEDTEGDLCGHGTACAG